MVNIVTVGSVALDTVKTPFGEITDGLGGSATYSSFAASFFSKPGIVGVIGEDFPSEHIGLLNSRGIDTKGLSISKGKTFKWKGRYEFDMNQAHTIKTELNSFSDFKPELPEEYKNAEFLLLGNISPHLQLDVLKQMHERPKLVISDTMNYWIEKERETVLEVIKQVDIALMNDAEARMLFKTPNLVKAAGEILKLNSDYAIIKKGEHGSLLFTPTSHFAAPGFPLESVVDPTGAGDSFAGAFLGYLAKTKRLTEKNIRKAMIFGSTVASFNAEGFSLNRMKEISIKDIRQRVREFKKIVDF